MKRELFTAVVLLLCFFVSAQEPLSHEKKVYVGPDGKNYVNKSLPIYFKFSTSPEANAETYPMKSEATPKYANPIYMDSEGYNTLRSPSAVDPITKKTVYPLQDVIYEIYADGIAPNTKHLLNQKILFTKKGINYFKGNLEVKLESQDATSGIEKIYYSLNAAPFIPYSTPLLFNDESIVTLKYYAVDHTGNAENVKTFTFAIDKTAPVTTLKIKGDQSEQVLSSRTHIILKASDSLGMLMTYYKVDAGKWNVYTSAILASMYAQGEHTLTYYSKDLIQNTEVEKTFTFYVDNTAPTVMEEIMGNSYMNNGKEYASGKSKLKLTAFDNKAGIKEIYYSVNGSEFKLYEGPVSLIASGGLMVKTYAIDKVNNRSTGGEQSDFAKTLSHVDLAGPILSYSFIGPSFSTSQRTYISHRTKLMLKGVDAEAGLNRLEYTVNGGPMTPYVEPFRLTNEGNYEIKMYGFDNVENTNLKTFSVFVDTTGPEITENFSNPSLESNSNNYPSYTVVFLSASDKLSGFEKLSYSLNNTPEKLYTDKIQGFQKNTPYTLKVNAFDKLGNKQNKVIQFNVSQ